MMVIAIAAHKIPAGFSLASVLKLAGYSRKKILLFLTGVSLATPIGILLPFLIVSNLRPTLLAGILLSVSSGTFLYIGACDLLPEVHRHEKHRVSRLCYFSLGILVVIVSELLT
jgi:zinc transporter ZupT